MAERDPDGRAISAVLVVAMAPVVVAAVVHGGAFGVGEMLCAGVAGFGVVGWLAHARAPSVLPRARVRRSRPRRTR